VYESQSQHANAALVLRVVDLLKNGRAGLVTDVDGTISSIVPRPEDAQVLPRARLALDGLRSLLAVTAVVSGRTAADARRMVGVDGLTYVGNHGLEIWRSEISGPQIAPEARPWVPRISAVLEDVARHVRLPGVLVEDKGASGSLHYRLTADPARARTELLAVLARRAVTSGLRIEEGRMVINLLPPLMVTKGSAVTWLVREHKLERLVYLGDDITDAHAFRALAGLRQTGNVQTLSIGVVGQETPPSVRQLADATLPTVTAVADLLCQVFEQLRSSVSMDERAPTIGRETYGQGRARD
jgi:trehalose 6-phosphate phosphatase